MGKGVSRHTKSWMRPMMSGGNAQLDTQLAKIHRAANVRDHRRVWTLANGDIPSGYEIHHIDGDHENNILANLACLTIGQHRRLHSMIERGQARFGDYAVVEMMSKA